MPSSVIDFFIECDAAYRQPVPIRRGNRHDKEFHFQNWVADRLRRLRFRFFPPDRNVYPDFRLRAFDDGYETKGLESPGRVSTFDCNSQLASGEHDGQTIYYVFGRYPKTKARSYPVLDLVICHGNFLNRIHAYVHENTSFPFGSYGDVKIRDRKMYIARTPFSLLDGVVGEVTLILPEDQPVDGRMQEVGRCERVEAAAFPIRYSFDLQTARLTTDTMANPTAGNVHRFVAYRVGGGGPAVRLKAPTARRERRRKNQADPA